MKKTIFLLFISLLVLTEYSSSQVFKKNYPFIKQSLSNNSALMQGDTIKPVSQTQSRKFSLGGIFVSVGTGLSVPLRNFFENSNPAFGILGRIEYSSYSVFPFVIGGEVNYFSYGGSDDFKTLNLLSNLTTKVLSYGLNIEYVLARLLNSSYTIPFVTVDVKNNSIKREYDDDQTISGLPRTETMISAGAGVGFTLFVVDFYVKYNYMKGLSSFGAYAKIKFPVIRF